MSSLDWQGLGVRIDAELHGGKQSRVFAATVEGRKVALKLIDARLVDATVVAERLRVAELLAEVTPVAIPPVRIGGHLVQRIRDWLVTATQFVDGRHVDITAEADARLMGRTLAHLHDRLARLPASPVPPVAALDVSGGDSDPTGWQLLHGDFGDQNAIATPDGLRVFDFDECGYGPVAYDVANSLYMVLFDSEVDGRPDRYVAFRPAFLDGYGEAAGAAVDRNDVDALIDTRIEALGRWLDDLANAPIGIRTASPQWRRTLRAFVSSRREPGPSPTR